MIRLLPYSQIHAVYTPAPIAVGYLLIIQNILSLTFLLYNYKHIGECVEIVRITPPPAKSMHSHGYLQLCHCKFSCSLFYILMMFIFFDNMRSHKMQPCFCKSLGLLHFGHIGDYRSIGYQLFRFLIVQ